MSDNENNKNLDFPNSFRRGINMGNILENKTENKSLTTSILNNKHFSIIRNKGFDFVRIPVRWFTRFNGSIIEEAFFERVENIMNAVLQNNLGVIINIHHYDELTSNPSGEEDNLYKIWEQISDRFKDLPQSVVLEVLNEPKDEILTSDWCPMQNKCIEIIRKTNPARKIIISGADMGDPYELGNLIFPDSVRNDPNIIASFHYYIPLEFTHQGASWWPNSERHMGTRWFGTEDEKSYIENDFKNIREWSLTNHIPVILGEFGAYEKAEYDDRVRYTAFIREMAEKHGFSWAYWEFCSSFGIYDKTTGTFKPELTKALIESL